MEIIVSAVVGACAAVVTEDAVNAYHKIKGRDFEFPNNWKDVSYTEGDYDLSEIFPGPVLGIGAGIPGVTEEWGECETK